MSKKHLNLSTTPSFDLSAEEEAVIDMVASEEATEATEEAMPPMTAMLAKLNMDMVKLTNVAKEGQQSDHVNVRMLADHMKANTEDKVFAFIKSAVEGSPNVSLLGYTTVELHDVLVTSGGFTASKTGTSIETLKAEEKTTRTAIRSLQSNNIINRRETIEARTQAKGRSGITTYFSLPLKGLEPKAVEFLKAVFMQLPNISIPADGILKGKWDITTTSAFNRKTDTAKR